MDNINILITSASRKVWLIKKFREAYKKEKLRGRIIATDLTELTPAMQVADRMYIVPRRDASDFADKIISICKKERIKIIIPTSNSDLVFFSRNRRMFESLGILLPISQLKAIETCVDKQKFFDFCDKNSIKTPKIYSITGADSDSVCFPVVVKPRDGAGSLSTFVARNNEELSFFLKYVRNPIVQEFVQGVEYTIDAFVDMQGDTIFIIPRERLLIVAGESYKGRTVKNDVLIKKTAELIKKIGCLGHLTIQCIEKNGEYYFIDLNPRFGGGAALGIEAGGDSPRLLLRIAAKRKVVPLIGKYTDNLYMLRYTDDIFMVKR